LKHFANKAFWKHMRRLPVSTQKLAKKNYELLKKNPNHPSLHFKKIGRFRSVRVGLNYRALGVAIPSGILWFWIGNHGDYDKLIS